MDLAQYEHSLRVDADDAARVRPKYSEDIPLYAADEDRARRRQAMEEAAKVRKIYEEMVLRKPAEEKLVSIGGALSTPAPSAAFLISSASRWSGVVGA